MKRRTLLLFLCAAALAPAAHAGNSSAPIALDRNENQIWAVNPDNNTVAVVDVGATDGTKAVEIPVGTEPQSIAVSRDNAKVYVANAVSGTVSVIDRAARTVTKTIKVGVEPWALVLTPNGRKLYVANSSSGSVSVIDTATDTLTRHIFNVGQLPRALAVTDDGDANDDDEKVYVAWFLAVYRPGDIRPGDDTGKVGKISVISTATDKVTKTIQIEPIADTGFKSDGDALNKVAPTGTATVTTGAFPNVLASLAIKGNRLYVPSTGSSPNGPVRFNLDVQGLLSVVDTTTDTDLGKTINLNKGINFETASVDGQGRPVHRFVTNPYDFAIRHNGNSGFVVSAASDMIVKVDINAGDALTINAPPASGQPGNIERVLVDPVGQNPRAMIFNQNDSQAFVWNYLSRNVTVLNTASGATVAKVLKLADQPTDPVAITVQRGKVLFNTSIGPVVQGQGVMSDNGWTSCASCHPNGLTDGVTWLFPSGPRLSTPLNSTFDPTGGNQRALNWSAIFDEVEDFEINTRNVAGGRGLILNGDGTAATPLAAFDPKNHGRNADRDSITDYLAKGIRSPISPVEPGDPRAAIGRKIFIKAGCATCHGGSNWTVSRVQFPPPPPASALVAEQGQNQLIGQLKQVGTFDASKKHEVVGTGANISKQALGTAGFNPPSLRGIHALGPYLHDGSAVNIGDALLTSSHVGTSPLLQSPVKRSQLIQFLRSIDDSTPPVSAPTLRGD